QVSAGHVLSVSAEGTIAVCATGAGRDRRAVHVGPEGTYLYDDAAAVKPFPLPSGALGPAPPWCLIGRIGDGPPFYIGPRKSWTADRPGPLLLGINDFDFTDNCGELAVRIDQPRKLQPIAFQSPVPPDAPPGGAVCGSSVVVFYLAGLRPDVVREMAAMGHLPHIKATFLEGGLEAARCYTAFPSDTITSNGTMWTGCFSDRHGIKGQVRFSRRTLHSESYLDPLGPSRAARLVAPQGVDKVLHNLHAGAVGALHGDAAEERFRQTHVTGVTPLFEHLRRQGGDWATGALPMMTEMPPLLWSRSIVRHLPYFHAHDAWNSIDDANTHYALFDLLDRRSPVTIIWLPETDSVSHKCGRGQFGLTRRTIARADLMIGRVVAQLRALGRLDCTYLFLVSDHGHHGGRDSHLSQFDIANELFYKPRELTPDGCWVGGGLGLSVRQHRFWNRHKGDGSRAFVFLDGDSDGTARLFLPRGQYASGRWMGPHRPGDLLEYRIAEHLPAVNLIETLTAVKAPHGNGYVEHPVDLVLVKLDDQSVLIATGDRGSAVIDRQLDGAGRWQYRYTPAEHVCATGDGRIAFAPAAAPQADPLGLLDVLAAGAFEHYYDEQTWLNITAGTRYPDSVVALTRHMLWQENLRYRECEFAPDLVITARPGWYFGTYATPGTTHGYPLADAMQATLFIAGPNIRSGARLDEPCRLVDLTPTLLEMTATPYVASELDGHPLRTIYEPASAGRSSTPSELYWHEIDLGAWH
ncbi:MAG TPA: alkaline phosphatase family protein, partial [Planctomycetaceae bacterium]|nr:alkaline phosphatase family protein [Planctomycetaceae bacterium]